jgi:hypothetical protein
VTDIQKAFRTDMNAGRGMPTSLSGLTNKSVHEFDTESKGRLVHFVVSTISNLCALICPNDPATLAQICAENIVGRCSVKDTKLQVNLKTVI